MFYLQKQDRVLSPVPNAAASGILTLACLDNDGDAFFLLSTIIDNSISQNVIRDFDVTKRAFGLPRINAALVPHLTYEEEIHVVSDLIKFVHKGCTSR